MWLKSQQRATLLLQAVVDTGDRSADGDLIVAVKPAWEQIIRLIESDPNIVFQIDPRKWEEMIAASYQQHGFDEVVLTPRSGDLGRDIIAVKRGFWSVRILESVKRYKPGNLVSAEEVSALVGVLAGDRGASKGIVSTTSGFAPRILHNPLIAPFVPHRIELVSGDQLLARLRPPLD
jgi:restriction system protein